MGPGTASTELLGGADVLESIRAPSTSSFSQSVVKTSSMKRYLKENWVNICNLCLRKHPKCGWPGRA